MSRGDRRGAPRSDVSWPVTVESFDGRLQLGQVVDMSTSGARLAVPGELLVGGAVTLKVVLPGGADRLEVVARVTRRHGEDVALDFVGLPETEARRVKPLLAPREARRRSPRARLQVPVAVQGASGEPASGTLIDLSAFGARVRCERPLRAGQRVTLRLDGIGGPEPLDLRAVVWDGSVTASVLVFVNLGEAAFRRLGAHVDRLVARGG